MRLAGVVLAGGISRRFGGDKLAAQVEGKPVIARVFEALGQVADDLYLSVAEESRGRRLLQLIDRDVRLILDEAGLGPSGPALAICTALSSVDYPYVLFVSGDTPWLDPEALARFVELCHHSGCTVGCPYWADGMVETLVQFHKRPDSIKFLGELARTRRGAMRPSDTLRAAPSTFYVDALTLTGNPLCFSNINTPEDLVNPRPRGRTSREVGHRLIGWEPKELFWRGVRLQARGMRAEAGSMFEREASYYEGMGLLHMAVHCLTDAAGCLEGRAADMASVRQRLERLKASLPLAARP